MSVKNILNDTQSKKIEKILSELGSLTVVEMSALCEMFKDQHGVESIVASGGPVAGGAAPVAAADEQTEFEVILQSFDQAKKIAVIKEVRAITGLGLKESKALVEEAPCAIKESVSKEEADEIKKKLEQVGCKIDLK